MNKQTAPASRRTTNKHRATRRVAERSGGAGTHRDRRRGGLRIRTALTGTLGALAASALAVCLLVHPTAATSNDAEPTAAVAQHAVARLAARAATGRTPAAGVRTARLVRAKFAVSLRTASHVSGIENSRVEVSVGPYHRCIRWPSTGSLAARPVGSFHGTVALGPCEGIPSGPPSTQPSSPAPSSSPVSPTPTAPSPVQSTSPSPTPTSSPTPSQPSPTGGPLVGVYNGGSSGDDAARTLFGSYGQISSSYYQPNQAGLNIAAEEKRIDKGIAPAITITTKGTQYLADIAAKSGTGWTWVNTYVDSLATLGKYAASRDLPLYATLDHEWEVKVNQGTLTGNAATTGVYAKALSNFFALVNAHAPGVTTLYWFGGSDKTKIGAVGAGLTTAPDMYSFDPYSSTSHPANQSFEDVVSPTVAWIKSQSWYAGQEIGLTELGADHADADMATYYQGLRAHLAKLGLAFGILFNRTDRPYVVTLTDSAYPKSVASVASALKS